jgi:hypothetical protein
VPRLSAEDQVFLAGQRADGWVISDAQLMLRTAHLICQRFRQGRSAEQINQELASNNADHSRRLALSDVLLSYSEC